jgi:hypothetical protein
LFFFEKKNQKTFANACRRWPILVSSGLGEIDKSFLVLFFKKEHSSFLSSLETLP